MCLITLHFILHAGLTLSNIIPFSSKHRRKEEYLKKEMPFVEWCHPHIEIWQISDDKKCHLITSNNKYHKNDKKQQSAQKNVK